TAATASAVQRCRLRWAMAGGPAERRQRSLRTSAAMLPKRETALFPNLNAPGFQACCARAVAPPKLTCVRPVACLAHNKLGPIREERTLKEALAEYERIEREDVPTMRLCDKARNSDKVRGEELESALSVRNLALLGRILATACLKRTESRGAHFRLDYPDSEDVGWGGVTRVQIGANETLELYTDPVKKPAISSARSEAVATK